MEVTDLLGESEREFRNAEFECGKLEDEANRCKAKCDSLVATIATFEEKKTAAQAELEPVEEDAGYAERVAKYGRAHVDSLNRLNELYAAVANAEKAESDLARAKALDSTEEQIEALEQKCTELRPKADTARAGLADAREKVDQAAREVAAAKDADPKNLREKRTQLENEQTKLTAVNGRVHSLSQELEATKERVSSLLEDVKRLQALGEAYSKPGPEGKNGEGERDETPTEARLDHEAPEPEPKPPTRVDAQEPRRRGGGDG